MSAAAGPLALVPHPAHPAGGVRGVRAEVARGADGSLGVEFVLDADPADVRVPAPGPPRMELGLWLHTCFEAFVALPGGPAYHEYNLAPSTAWTAFAFRGYRDGGPLVDEALAPGIAVARDDGRLALAARLPLGRLSAAYAGAALRLGLSAVVEHASGAWSYWALRHPPGPPDFHADECFALVLEA